MSEAQTNDVERVIREFLNGNLTADQLTADLQTYAERPDVGLRAFTSVNIDWLQVQQERLFKVVEVIAKITAPVLQAFFAGEIPLEEAAVQIAPFYLMWAVFGFDPPPDADPAWSEKREQLVERIAELGAAAGWGMPKGDR